MIFMAPLSSTKIYKIFFKCISDYDYVVPHLHVILQAKGTFSRDTRCYRIACDVVRSVTITTHQGTDCHSRRQRDVHYSSGNNACNIIWELTKNILKSFFENLKHQNKCKFPSFSIKDYQVLSFSEHDLKYFARNMKLYIA